MSYFKNMAFYIGYGYDRAKNAEAVEKYLEIHGYKSDKTANKKYRDQHAFTYGYNYIIADCNGMYYYSSKDYNYPRHSIPNQKPEAMKYTGRLLEGDFERNTMTFRVDGELILQAAVGGVIVGYLLHYIF